MTSIEQKVLVQWQQVARELSLAHSDRQEQTAASLAWAASNSAAHLPGSHACSTLQQQQQRRRILEAGRAMTGWVMPLTTMLGAQSTADTCSRGRLLAVIMNSCRGTGSTCSRGTCYSQFTPISAIFKAQEGPNHTELQRIRGHGGREGAHPQQLHAVGVAQRRHQRRLLLQAGKHWAV